MGLILRKWRVRTDESSKVYVKVLTRISFYLRYQVLVVLLQPTTKRENVRFGALLWCVLFLP